MRAEEGQGCIAGLCPLPCLPPCLLPCLLPSLLPCSALPAVHVPGATTMQLPKSESLTRPLEESSRLSGLTSPCMMWLWCR